MNKPKEQIQIQVGAFLAVAILLFMAAVFLLGSKFSLFQTHYQLVCFFDDISGLRIGAPVHLVGINVGFIDSISFEDRRVQRPVTLDKRFEGQSLTSEETEITQAKVRVAMKIDTKYRERIRGDSVASVVTQGLLGDRMIYITVGSKESVILADGDELLQVKNPTGFTQLVEKGDDLMLDAQTFVQNTNHLVLNLNEVLQEVISGGGLAHEVIYDPKSGQLVGQVNAILNNLDATSSNLAQITHKINDGRGTLGALVNDDSLYADVKTLMGKANRNKLIRSVIRYTMQTKENQQLK